MKSRNLIQLCFCPSRHYDDIMRTISQYRTTVTSFSSSSSSSYDYDSGEYVLSMAAATIYSSGMHDTSTTTSTDNNIYVASALSDKSIVLYDIQTNCIIDRISNAHTGPISEIQFYSPSSSSSTMSLISAGHDGYVKTWDFRCRNSMSSSGGGANGATTAATGTFKLGQRNEKALCVSVGYSGSLAAVGTDQARISFFDLRRQTSSSASSSTAALLGNYIDAHTDDVTCVKFQTIPSASSSGINSSSTNTTTTTATTVLATASEDGLINIYNPSASTEETALLSVINVNCPIRNITFFGPNYQGMAVLTGNESMVCYHWDSGQLICNVGNGGGGMGGLRRVLSDTIRLSNNSNSSSSSSSSSSNGGETTAVNMSSSSSSSSAIGGGGGMMMMDDDNDDTLCDNDTENTIDYLIGCQWTTLPSSSTSSSCQPALHLLAGNTNGNVYIFQIDTNSITPLVQLSDGHRGCIRDFVWIDNDDIISSTSCNDCNASVSKRRLITGGEDARLCEWDLLSSSSSSSSSLLCVGKNTTMSTSKNTSGGRARSSKYGIGDNSAADIRKEKKKTKTKLGYPY